ARQDVGGDAERARHRLRPGATDRGLHLAGVDRLVLAGADPALGLPLGPDLVEAAEQVLEAVALQQRGQLPHEASTVTEHVLQRHPHSLIDRRAASGRSEGPWGPPADRVKLIRPRSPNVQEAPPATDL